MTIPLRQELPEPPWYLRLYEATHVGNLKARFVQKWVLGLPG